MLCIVVGPWVNLIHEFKGSLHDRSTMKVPLLFNSQISVQMVRFYCNRWCIFLSSSILFISHSLSKLTVKTGLSDDATITIFWSFIIYTSPYFYCHTDDHNELLYAFICPSNKSHWIRLSIFGIEQWNLHNLFGHRAVQLQFSVCEF